jgi:hypothetical protein
VIRDILRVVKTGVDAEGARYQEEEGFAVAHAEPREVWQEIRLEEMRREQVCQKQKGACQEQEYQYQYLQVEHFLILLKELQYTS